MCDIGSVSDVCVHLLIKRVEVSEFVFIHIILC
jgi:hypothetical protein